MNDRVDLLLQQSVEKVQIWLDRFLEDPRAATLEINRWLNFAQAASGFARFKTKESADERLQWAHVAITVYNYMARRSTVDGHAQEMSAMGLHAVMIGEFGVVPGHPVLDARVLEDWFFDGLQLSVEQTKTIISLKPKYLHETEQLNAIKNKLFIVKVGIDKGYIPNNTELYEWMQIELY